MCTYFNLLPRYNALLLGNAHAQCQQTVRVCQHVTLGNSFSPAAQPGLHHGLVSDESVCGDDDGTRQKFMERVHD